MLETDCNHTVHDSNEESKHEIQYLMILSFCLFRCLSKTLLEKVVICDISAECVLNTNFQQTEYSISRITYAILEMCQSGLQHFFKTESENEAHCG